MIVRWIGHASFFVEASGVKIYIDPFKLPDGLDKADMILITHSHYDHCDVDSIGKIKTSSTLVVAPECCRGKVSGNVRVMKAGESLNEGAIVIHAVAAYNIGKPHHPPGFGLGFVVEAEGKKIYHVGDSDFVHEMTKIMDVNVALLPVGGKYTMNYVEAVEAVKALNPEIAVPMHYGRIVGSDEDALNFRELAEVEAPDVRVVMLEGHDLVL